MNNEKFLALIHDAEHVANDWLANASVEDLGCNALAQALLHGAKKVAGETLMASPYDELTIKEAFLLWREHGLVSGMTKNYLDAIDEITSRILYELCKRYFKSF